MILLAHTCVLFLLGLDWQSCPAGTYNAGTGLTQLSDCTDCDGGKYCDTTGLDAPAGDCDAGYYCQTGTYAHVRVG